MGAGAPAPVEITLANAPAALEAAPAAGTRPSRSGLPALLRELAVAVAVLVALRREAGIGADFRNPPPNLRKLASLYGVEAALFGPPAS
jgi:hypothetical protein